MSARRSRLNMVLLLLLVASSVTITTCSATSSQAPDGAASGTTILRSDPRRGGKGSVADVAVFIQPSLDDDAMQAVGDVVMRERTDGRGEEFIDGVFGVEYDYLARAIYVVLDPDFTEADRDRIAALFDGESGVLEVRLGHVIGDD